MIDSLARPRAAKNTPTLALWKAARATVRNTERKGWLMSSTGVAPSKGAGRTVFKLPRAPASGGSIARSTATNPKRLTPLAWRGSRGWTTTPRRATTAQMKGSAAERGRRQCEHPAERPINYFEVHIDIYQVQNNVFYTNFSTAAKAHDVFPPSFSLSFILPYLV